MKNGLNKEEKEELKKIEERIAKKKAEMDREFGKKPKLDLTKGSKTHQIGMVKSNAELNTIIKTINKNNIKQKGLI